ncbi:hypothetical protein KAR91_83080 [Candidatus Pacearchaeota archaeon]|nr:hypothetical protein [Candidatus Pacearchaeota archaeon]
MSEKNVIISQGITVHGVVVETGTSKKGAHIMTVLTKGKLTKVFSKDNGKKQGETLTCLVDPFAYDQGSLLCQEILRMA